MICKLSLNLEVSKMNETMREKRINALLYAMEKYPDIGRTKLNKFIFFIDLIHYNKYGTTLLDNEYQAKKAGPVPLHVFMVTESRQAQFDVCKEQIEEERTKYSYHPRDKSNKDVFTSDEIEIFDNVIDLLKAYNTLEISDITHQMSLWKKHEGVFDDPISLEEFELSDYELDEFISHFDYLDAKKYAESLDIDYNIENNGIVPQEFIEMQLQLISGE